MTNEQHAISRAQHQEGQSGIGTRKKVSIRLGTTTRKPWVASSATDEIRHHQALFYLLYKFDHEEAFRQDFSTMILAKAVCNLRNYYLQDKEKTVKLIQNHFNPKCWDEPWSPEAVGLMWECVENFTPSLGLVDEAAVAKQKARLIEQEVAYLLQGMSPGGRVQDKELLKTFREWNPDIEVTSNLFSRAVKAVTGTSKLRSDGKGFWVGFHFPDEDHQTAHLSESA